MRKSLALLAVILLAGCGSSSNGDASSGTTDKTSTTPGPGGDPGSGSGTPTTGEGGGKTGGGGTTGGGTGTIAPGTLTAGAWDDNLNWDFYRSYLSKVEGTKLPGIPLIPRADRLRVSIVDADGKPLAGANVVVKHAGTVLLDAPAGADGGVLFFPTWVGVSTGDTLDVVATSTTGSGLGTAKAGDGSVTVKIEGAHTEAPRTLDIALVLDTTGSMGDELAYLKTELDAIAGTLTTRHPGVAQRWALVLYRDAAAGDEYGTRVFDFTTDLATFRKNLAAQSYGGGGDYPESPELALRDTATLSWSTANAARLAFWVADAPHHADKVDTFVTSLRALRTHGVHVYPVAASGADELVEFSMRTSAQVTGGRYLFLTDDSGIGGAHKEPTLPCYFVTKFSNAMVRMVAMELTGTYLAPATEEIIRVGGPLKDGQCALESGQVVQAY
jgi:hypothetical protein